MSNLRAYQLFRFHFGSDNDETSLLWVQRRVWQSALLRNDLAIYLSTIIYVYIMCVGNNKQMGGGNQQRKRVNIKNEIRKYCIIILYTTIYIVVAGGESGSKLEFMERYSNSALLGVSFFCLLDERE